MSSSPTFDGFADSKAKYAVHHGDCIEEMARMPKACVDLAVFSPPFSVALRIH